MQKKLSLLVYEKEIFLNSILQEQFSYCGNYQLFIAHNEKKLLELINNRFFDFFILNLDIINNNLSTFLKNFRDYNKHENVVAYYVEKKNYEKYKNYNIGFFKKPFKFNTLLNYLDNIKNTDFPFSSNYLTEHIEFIAIKKIIYNSKNNYQEHLTEKETYLLDYLNKNRNTNITRTDLLKKIWGFNEDINTHTLETHMYRLRLKLNKIEPNLPFSLLNQNGLYCMKDNN
jgi:DNA-binding response OmpR family regulator